MATTSRRSTPSQMQELVGSAERDALRGEAGNVSGACSLESISTVKHASGAIADDFMTPLGGMASEPEQIASDLEDADVVGCDFDNLIAFIQHRG